MRIALSIGSYDAEGGGAERWTDRFARALVARRHEVHLLARRFRHPPTEAVCHAVDTSKRGMRSERLCFADRLARFVDRESFDIVHDMGDGYRADVFLPHHGTRRGGFLHNAALAPAGLRTIRGAAWNVLPRYREFATLERRQYGLDGARVCVALSRMVAEHMRRFYGVADDRIRIIYNGVDVERFRPEPRQRAPVRHRLAFANNVTVFLVVAHNFRLKGVDTLIRAIGALSRAGERIGLVVVGDGNVPKYQALAQREGCSKYVRFVGSHRDPRPFFHAADVYAQPTYYDPCSLVVLEALACGLPIITSRCNGAGELVTPGVEGWIVDNPADAKALADVMAAFCDPEARPAMRSAARVLAILNSFDRNVDEMLALYAGLVGRTARAA